jgi:hypothetical protein
MVRRLFPAVLMVFSVLAVSSVMAQNNANNPAPPPHHWVRHGGHAPGAAGFAFDGFARFAGGKTVSGSPVSSTISVTHTQKLVDGNSITHTTTTAYARDSVGRTYREVTLPAIGPLSTTGSAPHLRFVTDPVAGVSVTMDERRKTAQQFPLHVRAAGSPGAATRGQFQRGANGPGGANHPNVTTQSLGSKMVNGVNAEGTLITHVIPAGRMGNAAAIVSTTERWYSPELQMVVCETRTDPRYGTTTMNMTNINRSEPDPALFAVPPEYTLKSGPAAAGRALQRPQQ